jgi:hypothetical protein
LTDKQETAAKPTEDDEYRFAPGSGVAAVLLFLHIALTGYLAFAMFFVLRSWKSGVIAAPNMSWQYFFPAGLALFSFFPTDALTRTVAYAARASGTLALIVTAGATIGFAATHAQNVMPWLLRLATVTLGGFGAGVLAGEWFRVGLQQLPPARRIPIVPFNKLTAAMATLVLAVFWMALMLLLARPAFQYTALEVCVAVAGSLLVLSRLLSSRRP